MYNHFFWILRATRASCISAQKGCTPVGCVGLYDSVELSLKSNSKYKKHAEILVVNSVLCILNTYNNLNITFYVTLEPCFLCCLYLCTNVVFFSIFSVVKKKKFTTLIFLYNCINYKLRRLLLLYFFQI